MDCIHGSNRRSGEPGRCQFPADESFNMRVRSTSTIILLIIHEYKFFNCIKARPHYQHIIASTKQNTVRFGCNKQVLKFRIMSGLNINSKRADQYYFEVKTLYTISNSDQSQ